MVSPAEYVADGPKPVLVEFLSKEHETTWLLSQIKELVHTSSNVIICRNRVTIDSLRLALSKNGINANIIDKDHAGFANVKGVYLSTFHAAKGLEFENVFVPFICEGIYPDPEVLENTIDEKGVLANELKLLYVAATRSKYGLFMSFHKQLSRLFPVDSSNYQEINGEDLL